MLVEKLFGCVTYKMQRITLININYLAF